MQGLMSKKEVQKALEILFGGGFSCYDETLQYLQTSGIKKAFRSKAMLYHPDRAQEGQEMVAFHELQDAYQLLMSLKEDPQAGIRILEEERREARSRQPKAPPRGHEKAQSGGMKTPSPRNKGDFFYRGQRLPRIPLRLGEYLYYSGRISWRMLIDAIVEQKKDSNRLFGEYFIKRGLLTKRGLRGILNAMERHNIAMGSL